MLRAFVRDHLRRILAEAQTIVGAARTASMQQPKERIQTIVDAALAAPAQQPEIASRTNVKERL